MSDMKAKRLAVLGAWTALQGFYVATHFSWYHVGILALGFIYLLVTTVTCKKQGDVVVTLGKFLGTTFMCFLGYYVVTRIVLQYVYSSDALNQFLYELEMGTQYISRGEMDGDKTFFLVIPLGIIAFMRKKLRNPMWNLVLRYAFGFTVYNSLLRLFCDHKNITVMYLIFTLMFMFSDILALLQVGVRLKTFKRWHNLLSILLLFVLDLRPFTLDPFTQPGFMEYFFLTCGLKWYIALYIFAVLLVPYLVAASKCDKRKVETLTDAYVFWIALGVLVSAFFLTYWYVGYWWVLVILYGGALIYAMTGLHPKKNPAKEGHLTGKEFVGTITGFMVLFTVTGHNGKLLIGVVLAAGFLILRNFYRENKPMNSVYWKPKAVFLTLILFYIACVTAAWLWCVRRMDVNFLLLAGMFAVSAGFVWFMFYDSGLFLRQTRVITTSVVIVFSVLCFALCCKYGSKIKVEFDGQEITTLEVEARGRDNEVDSVEYFWLDDYLTLDGDRDRFPEEYQLKNEEIPERDGRLKIVAKDLRGIVTERIVWIHRKPLW